RQHALPKHHIDAPMFDRALVFTRTAPRTQQIARAYLVDHYLPGIVAERFDTTKQNVFRAAAQILADAREAQDVFTRVARQWNQLALPSDLASRALPFFLQEVTLADAAAQAGCSVAEVVSATKDVVALFH